MKKLNEISITGFINRFLNDIQKGTQDRFIKQVKEKGVPPTVTTRLTKIEKEISELKNILKEL